MGNKVDCGDCNTQEKFRNIQNLGMSASSIDLHSAANTIKEEYAYIPENEQEFEKEKEQWRKIQATKSNILRPSEIEFFEKKSLFKTEKGIKVIFDNEKFDLKKFVKQNSRISALLPEIIVFNVFANVADALFELEDLEIAHANIHNETILLNSKGYWTVFTPNAKFVSLKKLSIKLREDYRHLIYNFSDERDCSQVQKDFFSLAITLLDSINSFKESEKTVYLTEEIIRSKMKTVEAYYSKQLVELLFLLTGVEQKKLPSTFQIKTLLGKLRDTNN